MTAPYSSLCRRCATALIVFSAVCTAQTTPVNRETSLTELVARAERQNAKLQVTREQSRIVSERIAQARAGLLPTLSLSSVATRQSGELTSGSLELQPREFTLINNSISFSQPLYRPAAWSQYTVAELQAERAVQEYEQARIDLIKRVAQAYFSALSNNDSVRLLISQQDAIQQQLAQARRSYELGIIPITDSQEAQSRLDAARAQELAARKELRSSLLELRSLMGGEDVALQALPADMRLPEAGNENLEQLLEIALRQNRSLIAYQIGVEIADQDAERIRSQHYPTLDLTAAVSNSRVSGSASSTIPIRTQNAQIGVQLNIPLYSGGGPSSRVREAMIALDKAKAELLDARHLVEEELIAAHARLDLGKSQVEALEKAVNSSSAALNSTMRGYAMGVRLGIDVLNAQQQLFQARRDLSKARYDYVLNLIRLMASTGVVDTATIAEIERRMKP